MSETQYKDEDFVYVDTDKKVAVGLVEWDKKGNVIPKDWPYEPRPGDADKPARKPRKRTYIWGSYGTMKKLYKLEGKVRDKDTDDYITLEEAVDKLQEEPYWD